MLASTVHVERVHLQLGIVVRRAVAPVVAAAHVGGGGGVGIDASTLHAGLEANAHFGTRAVVLTVGMGGALACIEHDIACRVQAQGFAGTQGRASGVNVARHTGQGNVVTAVDRTAHGRAAIHIGGVAAAGDTHANFTLDQSAIADERLGGAVSSRSGGDAGGRRTCAPHRCCWTRSLSGELMHAKAPTFRSLFGSCRLPMSCSAVMSIDLAVMLTSLPTRTLRTPGCISRPPSVPRRPQAGDIGGYLGHLVPGVLVIMVVVAGKTLGIRDHDLADGLVVVAVGVARRVLRTGNGQVARGADGQLAVRDHIGTDQRDIASLRAERS